MFCEAASGPQWDRATAGFTGTWGSPWKDHDYLREREADRTGRVHGGKWVSRTMQISMVNANSAGDPERKNLGQLAGNEKGRSPHVSQQLPPQVEFGAAFQLLFQVGVVL